MSDQDLQQLVFGLTGEALPLKALATHQAGQAFWNSGQRLAWSFTDYGMELWHHRAQDMGDNWAIVTNDGKVLYRQTPSFFVSLDYGSNQAARAKAGQENALDWLLFHQQLQAVGIEWDFDCVTGRSTAPPHYSTTSRGWRHLGQSWNLS